MSLLRLLQPEILLIVVGCACLMLGVSRRPFVRWLAPGLSLVALVVIFASQGMDLYVQSGTDEFRAVRVGAMANFAPRDATHLDEVVTEHILKARRHPQRLRSFYAGAKLPDPVRTQPT